MPQVPQIIEVLTAVGIPAVGVAGYEADDVLGTLAATEPGPVEVVSGDRDLFQLVDDAAGVRLLYCGRGVANLEVCDEAAVRARFGVPAAAYVDFAVLRGDPSDGLPGVPGWGTRPPRAWLTGTAGWPGSWPHWTTWTPGSRPASAPSWTLPATTWRWRHRWSG